MLEWAKVRGVGRGYWPLFVLLVGVVISGALVLWSGVPVSAQADDGYQKQESPLDTPWTEEVGPENALPEYPRPQMVREDWQNLNGVWQFAAAEEGDEAPIGVELEERILVPYPVESALSGIKRHEDRMFYRRTFEVPEDWQDGGQRLSLNFGAVDYEATVWVNGQRVGAHEGGYDKFSFDITDALEESGEQEVVVGVYDATTDSGQAVGKQTLNPGGIFYTPNSGIWQTVWMEPVSPSHISNLDMTPNLDARTLDLTVEAEDAAGKTVVARAYDGGRLVGAVSGDPNQPLAIPVKKPKLWSPDRPFLYDLEVELRDGDGTVEDGVESYFGMREVGVEEGKDGRPRMMLNDRFIANVGTLDQGYWPDGVYTAPTDEALAFDLEAHKELGYNMVRKHIKVEPDRWFYHADRLGLLVWQDMPSMRPDLTPNSVQQQQYENELAEMIREKKSFTSITTWVPYNEGWGEQSQQTTERVANDVKEMDPSRMVNTHSGVNCCDSLGDTGAGDIYDAHNYQDPALPTPFDDRATVAGEFGGVALQPAPENEYDPDLTFAPYGAEESPQALTERYEDLMFNLQRGVSSCGVSAGVYTEITDLEGEINGMYTYDRQVFKPSSMERISRANRAVINASASAGSGGGPSFPPGTPGLTGVGYYPFSEGSGDTTEDQVGGSDATLNGPQWTSGHPGSPGDSGLGFDGEDDFVDTNKSTLPTDRNYSVAAWVKLDDLDGFQTAVSQDGDDTSAFFLQYAEADDRLAFSFANARALAPEAPETDRWYHMVGVRDAENGQIKLYIDGELVNTTNACLGSSSGGDTIIGRGLFNGDPVDYWDGEVDQVHLYDRVLSNEEVAELYESNE